MSLDKVLMTTDLAYLAWSALLCILLWAPYVVARMLNWGIPDTVGYPENPPALPGWARRAERAHANLAENLAPFAALVLIAHVSGQAGDATAAGAALFFYARLIQAGVHIAGLPWIRTLAFIASWIGMLIIFVSII